LIFHNLSFREIAGAIATLNVRFWHKDNIAGMFDRRPLSGQERSSGEARFREAERLHALVIKLIKIVSVGPRPRGESLRRRNDASRSDHGTYCATV
jgi:hypothetical protein